MGSFYILVLDKNNMGSEGRWYVTTSRATAQELKMLQTHDDTIVMELPKTLYPGTAQSVVTLLNTHSNVNEQGKIYQVDHV